MMFLGVLKTAGEALWGLVEKHLGLSLLAAAIVFWALHTGSKPAETVKQITQAAAPTIEKDQALVKKEDSSIAASQKVLEARITELESERLAPQTVIEPVDYEKIDAMIAAQLKVPAAQVQTAASAPDKAPETTVDTKALDNYSIGCQESSARAAACALQEGALVSKAQALQDENTQLNQEVKSLSTLDRGGSWLHKLGRTLKTSACGAAGAGVGLGASKAVGSGPAAIGALATWGVCEFVSRR